MAKATTKTKKSALAKKQPTFSKTQKYWEGIGRRKTSTARVRIFKNPSQGIMVNQKPYQEYFRITEDQLKVISPLEKTGTASQFGVSVKVQGGGFSSQAEAVRHGAARALLEFNPQFRQILSQLGFLRRDPRMRERKKFGLKRARRAPQWAKR